MKLSLAKKRADQGPVREATPKARITGSATDAPGPIQALIPRCLSPILRRPLPRAPENPTCHHAVILI